MVQASIAPKYTHVHSSHGDQSFRPSAWRFGLWRETWPGTMETAARDHPFHAVHKSVSRRFLAVGAEHSAIAVLD